MLTKANAEKRILANSRATGIYAYETRKYQYSIRHTINGDSVVAISKDLLDTTAALDSDNWIEITK